MVASEIRDLCIHIRRHGEMRTRSVFICDPGDGGEMTKRFSLNHLEGMSAVSGTLTLKSLIYSPESAWSQGLSTKQRRGIAAALCWSMLHLSGSPWLGENWDQIQAKILTQQTRDGRDILSRYPCVSCLFPLAENADSQPVHTSTSNNDAADFSHLISNKPVFELGILLIELCLNKSIGGLGVAAGDQESGGRYQTTMLDDYSTAVRKLDEVRRLAGDAYGNAAERCIKFVFQGSESTRDFDLPNFRCEFYNVVVAPVQATYDMIPDTSSYPDTESEN